MPGKKNGLQHEPAQRAFARQFINEIRDAYALCKIVTDKNMNPVDFRILDFNPAFELLTGLDSSILAGECLLESDLSSDPFWNQIFKKTASAVKNAGFEIYSKKLDKHFRITAAVPEKGIIALLLEDITDVKSVERAAMEKLSKSEEKFRLLTERSNVLICEIDSEGIFLYVNPAFKDILGYEQEELIGRSAFEIGYPPSFSKASKKLKEAAERNNRQENIWKFKDKSGNWHWLNCFTKTNINSTGEIRINTVAIDITKQKNAEEELHRQEQEYKTLVESVPDIIARYDRNFRHIFVNKAIFYDTGISPKSLIGKNFREMNIKSQKYIENAEAFLRAIFEKGEEMNSETFLPGKKGAQHYLSRGIPEFGPDGSVATALVISRNITGRKKAENALKESEKRFETVFRDSPVCTSLTRLSDGRFIDVNEAFLRLFGFNRKEVIGCDPLTLNMWADPEDRLNMVKDLNKKGRSESFETVFRTKSGELRNVIVNSEVINVAGESNILGLTLDITDRKIAEKQIRTALKEKDVLLRELYHRTKNNMQVICSMLSLYSSDSPDPVLKRAFMDMVNRIQSMALVHQKLYHSQDLSSISLKEYIMELVKLLFSSFDVAPGIISIIYELEDIYLPVDLAIPCGLIINELVTNSLKHAFPGGRKGLISIILKKEDDNIILQISDNGAGIPEGTDFKVKAGMGIKTVFNLAEMQLKGELSYESHNGISFCIRFGEPARQNFK